MTIDITPSRRLTTLPADLSRAGRLVPPQRASPLVVRNPHLQNRPV